QLCREQFVSYKVDMKRLLTGLRFTTKSLANCSRISRKSCSSGDSLQPNTFSPSVPFTTAVLLPYPLPTVLLPYLMRHSMASFPTAAGRTSVVLIEEDCGRLPIDPRPVDDVTQTASLLVMSRLSNILRSSSSLKEGVRPPSISLALSSFFDPRRGTKRARREVGEGGDLRNVVFVIISDLLQLRFADW
ncbi:hypothetical protein PRIPAC_88884, partial [Pristionchus pacificus]